MSVCTHHPKTGVVTSDPQNVPLLNGGSYAKVPVCDLPECIDEATKWVQRMSHKPAFHVRDEVPR